MPDEKMKVLVVGAHPSDPFANMGGTVAKHVKRGDDVVLMTLTYGLEVHTEYLIGKKEKEIRRTVQEKSMEAAAIVGVDDFRFLDFGDTPLVATRDNLLELGEHIQDIRPDLLISAHYPFRETQLGGDHGEAARMVETAPSWRYHNGKEPHRPKAIWFPYSDNLLGQAHPLTRIPDTYVDITDTIEQKIQACITTWNLPVEKQENIAELFRTMGRGLGRAVGFEYAEAFESPWLKRSGVDHLGT